MKQPLFGPDTAAHIASTISICALTETPNLAAMNFPRLLPGLQAFLPINLMPGGFCWYPNNPTVVADPAIIFPSLDLGFVVAARNLGSDLSPSAQHGQTAEQ